jgi:3-hydroxyisobutyrate dehydrogenase-like beta-hydroxyacid dehydrogenase
MSHVGFVGLGVMGGPMAGHLVKAGRSVIVWNRTSSKAEPVREQGAHVASSLADLASKCRVIFLCVGRTEDVAECLRAMMPHAASGTLFVDHSTISPTGAAALHEEAKAAGVRFLDAPITGGSMGAQKGTLTIFCGGEAADFEEAKLVMDAYAKRAELVGGPGLGQMMKAANQIAVGGALLALCESLAFAERAGLDLALTRDMLSGGAAGSWAMENYGPKILDRDWSPGFSVKNQRKDFGYCREAAAALELSIPGTELVDGLLAELSAEGRGEDATAALFEVLERRRTSG